MSGSDPINTGPSVQVIGEGLVINHYPIIPVNSWDDPEEFCPICGAYQFSCFTLPGIGGPHAAP